jgi:hypothetical protein
MRVIEKIAADLSPPVRLTLTQPHSLNANAASLSLYEGEGSGNCLPLCTETSPSVKLTAS